jgi:CubicO group peptidase (beta-lactamase class C family)
VQLSDPISKYLPPEVHVPTRNGKQITLLDLATHHSGLPRMPANFSWDYSNQQMFDFLSHYELTRDPGEKYEYSNYAVGLLGQILALRAGTDYETLLRTRITEPLGMTRTAVHLTPAMQSELAPGHNVAMKSAAAWEVPALAPAGGIRSTANDLLIFLAAEMGILHSPLQPAMKRMLSVHRPATANVDVALGWHVTQGAGRVFFHNGQTNGYFAFLGFDASRKVGIVVLSNSTASIEDIAWQVLHHPVRGPMQEHIPIPNLPQ